MNKVKKIILTIFIMLLAISCFLITNKIIKTQKPMIETPIIEDNDKDNKDDDEIVEDDKGQITIKGDNHVTYGDDNGRILSEAMARTIEEEARRLVADFKFFEAERYVANAIAQYNIKDSESFKYIKGMYDEFPIICKFSDLLSYGENQLLIDSIKSLKDNENFFISVMWLEMGNREYFIETTDSVNPVFSGGITVLDRNIVKAEDREVLGRVGDKIKDIEEIVEYKFDIEGNVLLAYIVEGKDRLHFYKIVEEVEDSTYYYTISEWQDLFRELNIIDEHDEHGDENEVGNTTLYEYEEDLDRDGD